MRVGWMHKKKNGAFHNICRMKEMKYEGIHIDDSGYKNRRKKKHDLSADLQRIGYSSEV